MSFYVRVFSLAEDFPSLRALCDELLEEGYEFATSPGKDEAAFNEADWKEIVFQYNEDNKPIVLERNTINQEDSLFKDEQKEFLDEIKEMPYSKGQKKAVEILKNIVQIYAFELDEDFTEEGWEYLECILDFLCDATDGYVQVDEEGIYDQEGNLMLELS
ncbi:MAG: hypothetical protein K0R84_481 [Clostridia bacterium]|nr:hypothetical protein [Clostridia bacterium]